MEGKGNMEGESSENKLGKLEESAAIQCLLNIRETASMTELQSSSSDTKTGKEDEAPSPKSDSFTSPYAGEIFGGSVGIKHHLVKALKGERKKKGVPSTSSGRSSPRSEGKRSSFFKKQTDAPDSPNSQKYSVKEGMRRSRALAMKRFAKPTSPVSTVRFETGMELCGLAKEKVDALRKEHGFNEVVAQLTPEWKKFVQRYLGVIPMLMFLTGIISVSIPTDEEASTGWISFGLLVFEVNLIVVVSYYSDRNAGNALQELHKLSAPNAVARRDSKWVTIPSRELVPSDIIMLKGGDVVPADARIILDGEPMQVDESLLTGESLAVTKHTGDDLLSGSVIEQGEREALITSTGANTFFGKTMSLLQKETDAGHLTQMLNQVTYIMTSLGFVGSLVIFVVALARGQEFGPTLVYALVVLVSVVPTGMPVVTTTVLAVGARELANEKAIVSRLSAMEEMSGMEILCSDKTGTLTKNQLEIDKDGIAVWGSYTVEDVLVKAAVASKWENQDAIDRTVTNAIGNDHSRLAHYTIKRFVPFNPVDKRTEATVVTNEGKTLLISKGAPNIMIDKLDDEKARAFAEQFMLEKAQRGFRTIGIICSNTEGARWQLVGFIPMMDPPREDSQETIRRAHELGIEVKMITGDQRAIAVETARRLGMGTNILPANELEDKHLADVAALAYSSDGFAGVYPEHKFRIVQALQLSDRMVGMTGDGVNDAPALKKAHVGIAVAGATEAAKGAADMILTKPGLSTIITAVTRSRKIFRRLESYVIYRLASSILVLLFTFFSLVALRFQLPSWSLILLSLVNDFTVMSTSLDNVYSSNNPLRWRMGYLLLLSCVIGVMAFVSCFILLLLSRRQSWDWWHVFGIMTDGAPDSKTYAAVFLSLSIAVQLNIFASRTNGFFFYFTSNTAPPPSLWLVLPVCCSCLSSTLISVYWRSGKARGPYEPMRGMSWGASGIVWVYHILFFVLLDAVKVFAVHFAENFPYINVGHLLLAGQLTVENAEKDKEQLRVVQKENRAKLLDKRGGTAADELAVKFALGKPIEARVATLEAENIRLKAALHRIVDFLGTPAGLEEILKED